MTFESRQRADMQDAARSSFAYDDSSAVVLPFPARKPSAASRAFALAVLALWTGLMAVVVYKLLA